MDSNTTEQTSKDILKQYMQEDIQKINNSDITFDWAKSSKFLFYLTLFLTLTFIVIASITLHNHKYKGNTKSDNVPASSLYTPEYK